VEQVAANDGEDRSVAGVGWRQDQISDDIVRNVSDGVGCAGENQSREEQPPRCEQASQPSSEHPTCEGFPKRELLTAML
jgi:hypothetical protein